MWTFNLVATLAADGRYRDLLGELSRHGEFHPTEFHGVILGKVEEPYAFLETIRGKRERQLIAFQDLGRVVPLDTCLIFTPATFLDQLQHALTPYVERLAGHSFYVRLERRGLKGRIVSPEVERALAGHLLAAASLAGAPARIAFEDPDYELVVETFGERCGIGCLTRALRQCYPFVRAP